MQRSRINLQGQEVCVLVQKTCKLKICKLLYMGKSLKRFFFRTPSVPDNRIVTLIIYTEHLGVEP